MPATNRLTSQRLTGAALAAFAGAAACGVEALRTHLWLSSLGPICGLDRPALFFMHCPACPAGLAFLMAASLLALAAASGRISPAAATGRA